ncbi:MAG: DUF190 domain-containing protein [Alphaproteobacteria bacterium]|nr:DUF190 domain-containing protein [Alphaproteobacteria bacterium]
MRVPAEACRLRIFIGSDDSFEGRPLSDAILTRARDMAIAGATATRGIAGFGPSSRLRPSGLAISRDLPVVIEIVDERDRIDAFLPVLEPMLGGALATIEPVTVLRRK